MPASSRHLGARTAELAVLVAVCVSARSVRAQPAKTQRRSPEPQTAASAEYSRAAVYAELGGMAFGYSVNLDYRPVSEISLRAGVSAVPIPWDGKLFLWVITPVAATALLGGSRHSLEIGLGYTHAWIDDDDARFVVPNAGYRYQKPEGGFLFRATATPLIRLNDVDDVTPWAGVSLGRSW